jgi:hypothetical protein
VFLAGRSVRTAKLTEEVGVVDADTHLAEVDPRTERASKAGADRVAPVEKVDGIPPVVTRVAAGRSRGAD